MLNKYTKILDELYRLNIIKSNNNINGNTHKILLKFPELKKEIFKVTNFLTHQTSVRDRLFYILNNIQSTLLCPECNAPLISKKSSPPFSIYCSLKCSNNSKLTRLKREQTNLKKYGIEHYSKTNECKEKIQQTNLKKYGVKYSLHFFEIKEQVKQTNLKNYGVENVFASTEIQYKSKQTNLKKYGEEHYSKTNEYKEHVKQTNLKKYGEEYFTKTKEYKEHVKQTNLKKYGVESHNQRCLNTDSLLKLNNKDWLTNEHYHCKKTLNQISQELECNPTTVTNYAKKYDLKVRYYSQSYGEKNVILFIEGLDVECYTNTRKVISPYELDIYIQSHNLAIEYCGLYWHSEQRGKDKYYHKRKHDLCKEKGIQLITIFEDEWQQKQEQVKNKILSLLNKNKQETIYARKTNIIEMSTKKKQEFFDTNHIQGNGPGSINIGLEYNDTLIACMSFIKQKEQHYLNRYATSCNVPGGFSKLLKYFQNNYEWQHLISFADLRWSNGNLYEKTGWKLDSILPPDYYYSPDGNNRYHKFNYRRKKLPKLLKEFNPNLSERKNCDINNISRIWDCGKLKYTMINKN